MAARRPFWKWRRWKSIGFCLWPPPTCKWNFKLKCQRKLDSLCHWSLKLIFKAKVKLESGNQKSNMAARRPFWKWHRWKSIGFCLWPPSTCIWNLKLKCQRKLDLCSGNHVVYRRTDGQTDGRTSSENLISAAMKQAAPHTCFFFLVFFI